MPLFDESFLSKLELLTLVTRDRAHGQLRGMHRSRRVGGGMVFADFRPYSEGDDVRNIDWGIYLRLDRLILRLFEEERDLPVYLLVDASASMDYGHPRKLDYAKQLAGALAYIVLLGHDRVNLAVVSDRVREMLPTRRGKNSAPQCFRFLEAIRASGTTHLEAALRRYFSAPRTRGVVLLISDFLDRNGVEGAFAILRRLRHDVMLLHVVSPQEREPQLLGEVVLVDAEDGTTNQVEVTPGLMAAYREAFERYARDTQAYCRKFGWGYARVDTDTPFEQALLRGLREQRLLR